MTDCPVCGHPLEISGLRLVESNVITDRGTRSLGPISASIMSALLTGPKSVNDLVEWVYGGTSNPPAVPENVITVTISRLRNHLALLGWTIAPADDKESFGAHYVLHKRD